LGALTGFNGNATSCLATGDITITGPNGNYFENCWTYDIGGATMEVSVGNHLLNIIQCRGSWKLTDYTNTAAIVADFTNGYLIVDSTCVAGVIAVGGMARLVDNSAVGCYVIDATITERGITDKVWDEAKADHNDPDSMGEQLGSNLATKADIYPLY